MREASTQSLANALLELFRGQTPRKPVAAEETDRVLPVLIRHEQRFHAVRDGSGERVKAGLLAPLAAAPGREAGTPRS